MGFYHEWEAFARLAHINVTESVGLARIASYL